MVLNVNEDQLNRVLTVVGNTFHPELVQVVEKLAIKHCGQPIDDGGEALSIVLQSLPVKKKILQYYNQDLIYSDVNKKIFHKIIKICDIDTPKLIDLLWAIPVFGIKKPSKTSCSTSQKAQPCCQECNHVCKHCQQIACTCANPQWNVECMNCNEKLSLCIGFVCVSCDGKVQQAQCGFQRFLSALKFTKALRNFFSHCTATKRKNFLQGYLPFPNYSTVNNWLSLSKKISTSFLDLINIMCNGDVFNKPLTENQGKEKKHHMGYILDTAAFTQDLFVHVDRSNSIRMRKDIPEILQLEKYTHNKVDNTNGYVFSLAAQIHSFDQILKIEIVKMQGYASEEVEEFTVQGADSSLSFIEFKDLKLPFERFQMHIEFELHRNGPIYVATSQEIHIGSWQKEVVVFDGIAEVETVQVSTEGRLVVKRELLVQKQPLGLSATVSDVDEVLLSQYKNSKGQVWSSGGSMNYKDHCFVFELRNLQPYEDYDLRVLCSKEIGQQTRYDLFEAVCKRVLDEKKFRHHCNSLERKLIVDCHSSGEDLCPQSIARCEQFEKLQTSKSFKLDVNFGGGNYQEKSIDDCLDYLTTYFKGRKIITFPPVSNREKRQSPMETISCQFQKIFESLKHHKESPLSCVIVSNFNFKKAVHDVGLTCKDFDIDLDPADVGNSLIIFDMERQLILSIRISLGTTMSDIRKCKEQIQRDLKFMMLLCNKFIGKNQLAIYGTLAVPELSIEELKEKLLCALCKENLAKFITRDNLKDTRKLKLWLQNVCEEIDLGRQSYISPSTGTCPTTKDCEQECKKNREWFKALANQIMVLMAYEQRYLPPIAGDDDMKIKGVLLTPEQNAIIHHAAKKKIIKGPFGCGKTIIGRSILESLSTSITDTAGDMAYFIGMDVYSLLQVEMEQYVESLKQSPLHNGLQIECVNILELSRENDSSADRVLNLQQCFKYLSRKHPDKKIHVLVEEFDSETFDKEQANGMKTIMQQAYLDSTIVVITQSIQKEWLINLGSSRIGHCFEETGAEIFNLDKTMRYTTRIHDIVIKAQSEVSKVDCHLRLPSGNNKREHGNLNNTNNLTLEPPINAQHTLEGRVQDSLSKGTQDTCQPPAKRRKFADSIDPTTTTNSQVDTGDIMDLQRHEEDSVISHRQEENLNHSNSIPNPLTPPSSEETNPPAPNPPAPSSNGVGPYLNLDSFAEHISIQDTDSTAGISTELKTSFKFFTDATCQHGIEGSIPKLLRVEPTAANFNLVCHYLKNVCFTGKSKRGVLLCNSLKYLLYLRKSLASISLKFTEHADKVKLQSPAPIEKKREIYQQWVNNSHPVLLCDSSGCRGLEYKKVVVLIDESEYYKRHLYVESMCRSTSELFFLSFKSSDEAPKINSGNMKEIVDLLVADGSVDDVTSTCETVCMQFDIERVTNEELYDADVHRQLADFKRLNWQPNLERYYQRMVSEEELTKDWSFEELEKLLEKRDFDKFNQLILLKPLSALEKFNQQSNWTLLHSACKLGASDCIDTLIQSGCHVSERETRLQSMPIHWAVRNNHVDVVKKLLAHDVSLLNAATRCFDTPLHFAAHWGHQRMVEFLLSYPMIDVNATDIYGRMADSTAMVWKNGRLNTNDTIKQLIQDYRHSQHLKSV